MLKEGVMTELNQKDTALFMQLVMTFQAAAWQQMGKIKNPITDKIERSLDQARYSIDMLEMLKSKTKGNLSDDELKFVNHVLAELQLNFVDELNKDKTKAEEKVKAKSEEKGKDGGDAKAEDKEKPEAKEGKNP
jgi:hypothetical protein